MLSSSLSKIRLYYSKARVRRRKQDAAAQLATLHAIFAGSAAIEGSKGFEFMKGQESLLRSVIDGISTPDQKANQNEALKAIQKNLIASGARVSHSPLPK